MNSVLKIIFFLLLFQRIAIGQFTNYTNKLDNKAYRNAIKPDLVFHHITQKEGLSYNLVNSFLKDRKGMLWIGTYNGLNKYDGAHFYTFHSGYGKNTLPNNSVHDLAEDKHGNIWGATDNDVFCLNPKTGNFKNYAVPSNFGWVSTQNIICDKNGVIWVANHINLCYFNIEEDRFQIAPRKNDFQTFRTRKNGLEDSPDGKTIYLATKQGLIYYDKAAARFGFVMENCDQSSPSNRGGAAALCETRFGHYWYVDNDANKIIAFDPYTKKIKQAIYLKDLEKMGEVATLFEDNDHMLWLSTWSYELLLIDYRNGNTVKKIGHNKNDASTIAGDFFWDAMHEADGTLWFGTVGGVSKCNTARSFYKVHQLSSQSNITETQTVNFVTENPKDKTWWIGYSGNILSNYNPITLKSITYDLNKLTPNKDNKTPSQVFRMIFLQDSILLFSNNGAWVRKGKNKFSPLVLPKPFHNWRLSDAAIYKNQILYSASGDKLLRWDLHNGRLDSLVFESPFIKKGNPYYLGVPITDSNGKVWMLNGWNWLTYSDGNKLKPIKMTYQDSTEADDGYFTSMIMDMNGDLWMSKKGDGLIYYNPSQNISKQYKQVDGLVMDHIMALAEDSDNKIWSACFNQFSVYNPSLNSFFNFTLPFSANNNGYVNYMAPLHNGNIISSVAGDIVEFFTQNIKPPVVKDKPLISMISINGKGVNFFENNTLNLSSKENSLRLKFGMLTDNLTAPYDMVYKLEGVEKDWSTTTLNFEANYNSLSSGTFTFKVKAVAKDKSWQTGETILIINIATPYYKTWWFLILSVLATFALFTIFYRMRMQQKDQVMILESKAQLLEKEKATVMYENLKQHLNPHFLFNSLTSLSSLIRIDQRQAGDFLDKMSKVYRYILKNKENETVVLGEELKFVGMYIQLQKTRFGQGLMIDINIPEEFHSHKIAPVTLQNLVENAIKHNIADPDSPLIIYMYIEDDYLVVQNNFQPKGYVETSNKQGQNSMISLYKYLSPRQVIINETEDYYTVKIPLI